MRSLKLAAILGALALAPTVATAADLGPLLSKAPPIVDEFAGGWYLRGDIGMTSQRFGSQQNVLLTPDFVWLDKGGFDAGMLYGVGLGYKFNNWFRFDVTGEYRGAVEFNSLDRNNATNTLNDISLQQSAWVGLANFYVDLGSWCCVTPFVGVGVGFSHITLDHFVDVALPSGGAPPPGGYAPAASKWNFAWALHAGLAYKVTPGFTVELAYRYLDLGDGVTGDIITFAGTNAVYNPTTLKDITSHDIKLGMRWQLGGCPDCAPASPVVRKY